MAEPASLTTAVSSRADDWLKPRWFALALGLFIVASFPQVILGYATFVYRDFGYFTFPMAHFQRESFWRGEVPLWNPYNCSGIPFLAQWNTSSLYPPAIFYLLFPLSWSLGVFQLLHLFLAGVGMYFLARRWTENNFAAAIAGVVFTFNGLADNCIMWVSNLAALAWMPWVVLLVERAMREGGRTIIVAAVVGAVQMLSGGPEIILMTWIFPALLACGAGWKSLCRFILIVALVTGLTAAQLLPFLDLLVHSHRGEQFSTGSWAMPVSGFANFLVPLFHCHPSFHGVYLQTGQVVTSSYYVGVATVALAALAIWRVRHKKVWLLVVLAVGGLVFALGDAGGIYGWLRHHAPGLGWMRYPVKFVVLPVFILPLLAAFAIAKLENGRAVTGNFFRPLGILGLAVILLTLLILWFAKEFPLKDDIWPETFRNGIARVAFFTVIFFILALVGKIRRAELRKLLQIILLVLVWLDLFSHEPRQQTVSRMVYDTVLPRAISVPRFRSARAMSSPGALAELDHSYIPDPTKDYLSRRWTLLYNCNLLENVPKPDGFFSLHLREEMDIDVVLFGSTNSYPSRFADFLGIAMISSPADVFDWVLRPTALPLVTGGQKPIFTDTKGVLEKISAPEFNPTREVYLPVEAKNFISVTNQTAVKISGEHFAAQRIGFEAEANSPAMIVVAQSFYNAWRVNVDDKPVRLWHANHAFQALEIPAGKHRVELVYVDRKFFVGAVASLISLIACAGVYWKLRLSEKITVRNKPLI